MKRVFYPGLEVHPQHALARRQMSDFGAVVSFELDGGFAEGAVCGVAAALFDFRERGSTESLVHAAAAAGRPGIHAGAARRLADHPGTVRLSIGLEEAEDLIADLAPGARTGHSI